MTSVNLVGRFGVSVLEFRWTVFAPDFNTVSVQVFLEGTKVQVYEFTPGNTTWTPGEVVFGGATLNLTMYAVPPTTTSYGELVAVSVNLAPPVGGTVVIQNMVLQAWDESGNVALIQPAKPPRPRFRT